MSDDTMSASELRNAYKQGGTVKDNELCGKCRLFKKQRQKSIWINQILKYMQN